MTRKQENAKKAEWKELLSEQEDFHRPLIREVLQQVLEAEMDEVVGASKSERTETRVGYPFRLLQPNAGDALQASWNWVCRRIGRGDSGPIILERYQRSGKALVSALSEMYVQGVSTRKVKAVTEELCGHEFSASTISRMNQDLDEELAKFAARRLENEYPYVILDARYEKIREDSVDTEPGSDDCDRHGLGSPAQYSGGGIGESRIVDRWKELAIKLKQRGISGVELVVSDDHAGLRAAIREVFPEGGLAALLCAFLRNNSMLVGCALSSYVGLSQSALNRRHYGSARTGTRPI